MHYWNKSNFEGLQALSVELGARDDLVLLAEYCRLRDAGLRREAFAALNSFLVTAAAWDRRQAQDAVEIILALYTRAPNCHQFLAQPLAEKFIFPVLQRWAEHEPDSIVPIRWLGILRRNRDQLETVLAADPKDYEVRRLLIERHLSDVDYATHHLGESLFVGDLDEALGELSDATDLINEAPDRDLVADLDRETREFGQMLFDWQAYKARPTGTFPEWCAAKGRKYAWSVPVYYSKGAP